jgi:hypothetical protein
MHFRARLLMCVSHEHGHYILIEVEFIIEISEKSNFCKAYQKFQQIAVNINGTSGMAMIACQ